MSDPQSFTETLSECFRWSAYATYDAGRAGNRDVTDKQLAGADLIVELSHCLDAVPEGVLVETQRRLVALGNERFEHYLFLSLNQIVAGAFLPANATEYMHGFNDALERQFGALPPSDFDGNAAEIIVFRDRAFAIDRTENPACPS